MTLQDAHRIRKELERAKRQSRDAVAKLNAQKKSLRTAERELKSKNTELNNLLDAIKRGEVDKLYGSTTESGAVSIQDSGLVAQNEMLMLELKSSNQKFSQIFAHCYDGIMIVDHHGHILDANPKVGELLGRSNKDILNSQIHNFHSLGSYKNNSEQISHFEIVDKKPHNGDSIKVRHALEESPGRTIEIQLDNGSIVELSLVSINWDGQEVYLTNLHDISALKNMMNVLTDSNEELARFAYVCSHDLQEPLRMIRSFSEKLEIHLAALLASDPKGRKYFSFISDGAERAQLLISDILTYSSITNNAETLQRVDTEQIVDEIAEVMRTAVDFTGGEITYESLPEVQGNKAQLNQLFQNLINNGMKYQKAGSAPHIHLAAVDAGSYWKFSINDNGIGMEERHLSKIFDVFQRLHGRREYAGTGIGLSICKKVVERNGGTLWVESTPGVGSTFYFTLLKPE